MDKSEVVEVHEAAGTEARFGRVSDICVEKNSLFLEGMPGRQFKGGRGTR